MAAPLRWRSPRCRPSGALRRRSCCWSPQKEPGAAKFASCQPSVRPQNCSVRPRLSAPLPLPAAEATAAAQPLFGRCRKRGGDCSRAAVPVYRFIVHRLSFAVHRASFIVHHPLLSLAPHLAASLLVASSLGRLSALLSLPAARCPLPAARCPPPSIGLCPPNLARRRVRNDPQRPPSLSALSICARPSPRRLADTLTPTAYLWSSASAFQRSPAHVCLHPSACRITPPRRPCTGPAAATLVEEKKPEPTYPPAPAPSVLPSRCPPSNPGLRQNCAPAIVSLSLPSPFPPHPATTQVVACFCWL